MCGYILLNNWSFKIFELVYVKYVLSMSGLILKIVATFVQKVGLIWGQDGFFRLSFSWPNIRLAPQPNIRLKRL